MGLLWMDYGAEFKNLVEAAFAKERDERADCFVELTPAVESIIYRDTRYNVDFLYTAYRLNDDRVMEKYGVWLFELMAGVLKDRPRDLVADYVVSHLGLQAAACRVFREIALGRRAGAMRGLRVRAGERWP